MVRAGYKQTEIGVIPEDWDVEQLGSHVFISSGESPSNYDFVSAGIPYFKVEQLNNDNKYLKTTGYYFEKGKSVPANSIIFPKRGASILLNKIRLLAEESFMDTNLMALTMVGELDAEYLFYFLDYRGLSNVADTTSIPQINNKHILPFLAPLPPQVEQQAIAEALSDVDGLIDGLEKLIAKKRDIKTATMQQLLTGKTRLPSFGEGKGYKQTELGKIPEDWEAAPLGDSVEKIVGGGTPSRSNISYWGGSIPWVTVKDFSSFNPYKTQESITAKGLKNSSSNIISSGTVITSTRMAVGKAVIYEVDVTINQDLKAIFPRRVLDTTFLYYWFQFNEASLAELGNGSTVMGLSLVDLRAVTLLRPKSIDEQQAIAQVLTDMDKELESLQTRLNKIKAIKQGMMQELLTGKIRLI